MVGLCTRGATRSCRTRVPRGFTRTDPTRYRVGGRPKTRRVFWPGIRVPEYPSQTSTRVPIQQRFPVVSMPDNNLQKPFKDATNDPAQYSHNTYQEARMRLQRPPVVRSISGRVPGYPSSKVSQWSTCLTIPPDTIQTRNKRSSLISTTFELEHLTSIHIFFRDRGQQRDQACLGLALQRRRASNSNAHSIHNGGRTLR